MDPTDAQRACFEAGIKFGALYHQFAGTPVSPRSAASLEPAIEEAIENQPYCDSVSVDIRADRLAADVDHGYAELTGKYLDVEIVVEYDDVTVTTSMAMEDGYPRMRIDDIETSP